MVLRALFIARTVIQHVWHYTTCASITVCASQAVILALLASAWGCIVFVATRFNAFESVVDFFHIVRIYTYHALIKVLRVTRITIVHFAFRAIAVYGHIAYCTIIITFSFMKHIWLNAGQTRFLVITPKAFFPAPFAPLMFIISVRSIWARSDTRVVV